MTDMPAEEYSRRLQERQRHTAELERRHLWTGNLRLLVAAAIAVLWWRTGLTGSDLYFGFLLAAISLFIALIVVHSRIERSRQRTQRAVDFYERGLARLSDRWSGSGDAGETFRREDHIYSDDLDILGAGSLFQLLCTARTRMGKARLAGWLHEPAAPQEIRARQQAITELRAKLDLREALATAGDSNEISADMDSIAGWAEAPPGLSRRMWPLFLVLSAADIAAIVYSLYTARYIVLIGAVVFNLIVLYSLKKILERSFSGLEKASGGLDSVAELARLIEGQQFESPRLRDVQSRLGSSGKTSSRAIARLGTLCDYEQGRRNMAVRILDLLVLYSPHVACALQGWRNRHGRDVRRWLDAVGEMEALAALSTYSFEHPADVFPELLEQAGPRFEADTLGHPLLPDSGCVRNSLALKKPGDVLLVSGSNMSGKSTLLRAVGVNAVLAMAGAPVRAARLRLSPQTVAASMRLSDSLQKGVSHFYAEISRVRQVVELSRRGPLLFLFDEILQGTNSEDRRAGAEGIVRTLIQQKAIGLVTTHDLALTSLAQLFPEQVTNVHFQEKLEAGKLSFDYRLRPGVVTTHNGVELMRSVGLEV